MMKKIVSFCSIAILMVVAFAFTANAQDYEDVVYLKNGSAIRGVIIEQVPNQSLKIQTDDGSVYVYNFSDIEKMTKEMPFAERRARKTSRQKSFNKPKGYFGLVEIGVAGGINGCDRLKSRVTIINGYRIIPQFAIGLGVSYQAHLYGIMSLPVFLHLRSDFLEKNISPFFAFNIGYNLPLKVDYYQGRVMGFTMEPTFGVGFNVGRKCRMTSGLGCILDRVHGLRCSSEWTVALGIKLGLSF